MNFTVYSKLGCGYCEKIISVLQLAELNFVEYKLDEDFDKKEFYSQFGEGSTFPQVTVDAYTCLLYTSPSPRDGQISRMPSSA